MPRRKRRRNPRLGAVLLAIALVALFIGGAVFYNRIMASHSGALPGQSGAYGDLLKVVDTFNRPDTRLKYKAMDISFNPDDHIPNWVSFSARRPTARFRAHALSATTTMLTDVPGAKTMSTAATTAATWPPPEI